MVRSGQYLPVLQSARAVWQAVVPGHPCSQEETRVSGHLSSLQVPLIHPPTITAPSLYPAEMRAWAGTKLMSILPEVSRRFVGVVEVGPEGGNTTPNKTVKSSSPALR